MNLSYVEYLVNTVGLDDAKQHSYNIIYQE